MRATAIFVGAFLAMESVSYATHRWLMHGSGMRWHRSHHRPSQQRFELNDLFPLCFSALGIALFVLASAGAGRWLWWLASGVAAYGACYLVVHEVFIHRRLPLRVPTLRYFRWLRESHLAHHVDGGEPYGMLIPIVNGTRRAEMGQWRTQARRADVDELDRSRMRSTR